jgi:anti-sigma factor RsiW
MEARPTLHPSAEVLRALALGKLNEAAASEIRSHLQSCPACRAEVAAAANDDLNRMQQAPTAVTL